MDGSVNPVRDKEIIDYELQLKDLETIESRIQKVQKQAQTGGDKAAKQAYDVLVQFKDALEQGKSARTVTFETKDEQKIAKELFLLTSKPVMYVCNVDEASAVNGNKYVDMVREADVVHERIGRAVPQSRIVHRDRYGDRSPSLGRNPETGVLRGHRVAHGRDDGRRDAQQTVPKAVDADDRLELGSLAGYAFLMYVHALRAVMVDRDVRGLGDDQIDVAVQSAVDVDVARRRKHVEPGRVVDDRPQQVLLAVAQVAGVMAAKKTWEIIPMCHPLMI